MPLLWDGRLCKVNLLLRSPCHFIGLIYCSERVWLILFWHYAVWLFNAIKINYISSHILTFFNFFLTKTSFIFSLVPTISTSIPLAFNFIVDHTRYPSISLQFSGNWHLANSHNTTKISIKPIVIIDLPNCFK